jgi:hypothetical protein
MADPIPNAPLPNHVTNPSGSPSSRPVVVGRPKDKGIAVLLAVLLGPLGLCYAAPGLGLGLFATYVLFVFLTWSALAYSVVIGKFSVVGGFLVAVVFGIHVAAIALAFRKTDEYNDSLGRAPRPTSPYRATLTLVSLSLVGIIGVFAEPELRLYFAARKEVADREQQAPLLETQRGNVRGFTVNGQRIIRGDGLGRVLASIEAAGGTLDKNPPFSEVLGKPLENELRYVYHIKDKAVRLTMRKSGNEYHLVEIYIMYTP